MTAPNVYTPYSTLRPMFPSVKPTWIPDELDQQRIMSYQLYEQIYDNVPDTFKLTWRGTEDRPIYVPTGKIIVNTTSRFVAPRLRPSLVPVQGGDAGSDLVTQAQQFVDDWLAREEFSSEFASNKRFGLIRGDWLWHVIGDTTKAPGTRVSIKALDPGMYFPIYDDDDVDKIIGVHIVDQFIPPNEKDVRIKRTTYRKPGTRDNDSQWVSHEVAVFKTDDWGGPESRPLRTLVPLRELSGITSLPVYHIKNVKEPQNPFGSSELRGLERIMAAVNQGISDEELSLALDGLGCYATDADPPKNDAGEEINWRLGPGRVVEHQPGTKFIRIDGVGTVQPYMDHLGFLIKHLKEASATPDVAIGNVDVTVAQSGIALSLQFAPILAKTADQDEIIFNKHDQMWFDLATQWFRVYEGTNFDGLRLKSIADEKLPVNRAERFAELNDMLDRKVISRTYYRAEVTKLGYVFPEGMDSDIIDEEVQLTSAAIDPFGSRIDRETQDPADSGGEVTD